MLFEFEVPSEKEIQHHVEAKKKREREREARRRKGRATFPYNGETRTGWKGKRSVGERKCAMESGCGGEGTGEVELRGRRREGNVIGMRQGGNGISCGNDRKFCYTHPSPSLDSLSPSLSIFGNSLIALRFSLVRQVRILFPLKLPYGNDSYYRLANCQRFRCKTLLTSLTAVLILFTNWFNISFPF